MNIALVHEFLVTWGGADLVVQKFGELYPAAPIYTAIHDRPAMEEYFRDREIFTSFLQKMPLATRKHRFYMPLFPLAFESFDLTSYDIVLSSHHMAAKSVITTSDTCHICFVHTPMRFAWEFFPHYMAEFGALSRPLMRLFFHYLRMHDVAASGRVDYYIANSHNTARRIRKHYRRESEVIHSPVIASNFHVSDRPGDYYLVLSRLVPYKRVDLAVEAFNRLGRKLVVVGDGPEKKRLKEMAGRNIEFVGFAPAEEVADYYANCRAFVFPGEEDFGITPLEAQASGRPVIAYGAGGALETVVEGKTGMFFEEQSAGALAAAVENFDDGDVDPAEIRRHAEGFDVEVFKKRINDFVRGKYSEFREEGGLK